MDDAAWDQKAAYEEVLRKAEAIVEGMKGRRGAKRSEHYKRFLSHLRENGTLKNPNKFKAHLSDGSFSKYRSQFKGSVLVDACKGIGSLHYYWHSHEYLGLRPPNGEATTESTGDGTGTLNEKSTAQSQAPHFTFRALVTDSIYDPFEKERFIKLEPGACLIPLEWRSEFWTHDDRTIIERIVTRMKFVFPQEIPRGNEKKMIQSAKAILDEAERSAVRDIILSYPMLFDGHFSKTLSIADSIEVAKRKLREFEEAHQNSRKLNFELPAYLQSLLKFTKRLHLRLSREGAPLTIDLSRENDDVARGGVALFKRYFAARFSERTTTECKEAFGRYYDHRGAPGKGSSRTTYPIPEAPASSLIAAIGTVDNEGAFSIKRREPLYEMAHSITNSDSREQWIKPAINSERPKRTMGQPGWCELDYIIKKPQ